MKGRKDSLFFFRVDTLVSITLTDFLSRNHLHILAANSSSLDYIWTFSQEIIAIHNGRWGFFPFSTPYEFRSTISTTFQLNPGEELDVTVYTPDQESGLKSLFPSRTTTEIPNSFQSTHLSVRKVDEGSLTLWATTNLVLKFKNLLNQNIQLFNYKFFSFRKSSCYSSFSGFGTRKNLDRGCGTRMSLDHSEGVERLCQSRRAKRSGDLTVDAT